MGYLMGGAHSKDTDNPYSWNTSTLIKDDGTQEPAFPLKFRTQQACAITNSDTVIITGGAFTSNTVSRYSVRGWKEDLPNLITGRRNHACTSYMSRGRRMLLVSGGYSGRSFLDSTEIYDPEVGSWRAGAALPSKRGNLRAVNIDGRILFFGGFDGMDKL